MGVTLWIFTITFFFRRVGLGFYKRLGKRAKPLHQLINVLLLASWKKTNKQTRIEADKQIEHVNKHTNKESMCTSKKSKKVCIHKGKL